MTNATILEKAHCSACKWPIVSALCNDGMAVTDPYASSDWWMYCSNKTCENHAGTAFALGDEPEFVVRE